MDSSRGLNKKKTFPNLTRALSSQEKSCCVSSGLQWLTDFIAICSIKHKHISFYRSTHSFRGTLKTFIIHN